MDIVERLRTTAPSKDGSRPRWYINPDGMEAADEIERLRQQNAKLVEALKETMVWIDNWNPEFTCDPDWKNFDPTIRAAITKATGGE